MTRALPLVLIVLPALVACGDKDDLDTACVSDDTGEDCGAAGDGSSGGGGDDGGGSSGDDGSGDELIALADAPPQSLGVDVSANGSFMQTWTVGETDTWSALSQSGVFTLTAQTPEPTQISFTVFDEVGLGGEWALEPTPEGQVPTGATLVGVESTGEGGQSASGTLTITAWHPPDSPQIYLASGTFEAEVFSPDEPEFQRTLEDGVFEWVLVSSF